LWRGVKLNLYSVKIAAYNAAMTKKPQKPNDGKAGVKRAPGKAAPARTAKDDAAKPRKTKAAGGASSYHHGALREALLEAAERVLERDGLAGLTLRAVAREAGVSHAAPTHHFGDLTGLVSELAAIGFRQFSAAMAGASYDRSLPQMAQARARAHAYVHYAQAHPGLYGLMFRTERLDMSRPSLNEAANASFAGFAGTIGAGRHEAISAQALTLDQGAALVRAWSLIHGFTMLLLDDRLSDVLRRLPEGVEVDTLLDAMLKSTIIKPSGT
jgi:AcrR family transcriptional regulator